MAGRKQHYIPQCLLKGFEAPSKGKKVKVWVFKKGQQPYLSPTEDVAAERYFYSGTSNDYSLKLDNQITQYETILSNLINLICESPTGCVIDSTIPTEVITHLTIRGAYLRDVFSFGMEKLIVDGVELFGDQEFIRSLMGIDSNEPPPMLKKQIEKMLSEHPMFESLDLPKPVIIQMIFTLMKERFDDFHDEYMPMFLTCLNELGSKASSIVQTEHSKALVGDLKPDARVAAMSKLLWTITEFPEGDLILPDCVAVSMKCDGATFDPYLMSSIDETNVVLLPICATKLLIGYKDNNISLDVKLFNKAAAICSHTFFVSGSKTQFAESLASRIGERSKATMIDSLTCGFNEAIAQSVMPEHGSKFLLHSMEKPILPETNIEVDIDHSEKQEIYSSTNLSYPVNFLACADQETAQKIAVAVNNIVSEMSHFLPLNRLEFITFAKDYISALKDLERGFPASEPLVPTNADFGVGVAMTPIILRDGVIKVCIVLQAWIGHDLICEDSESQNLAIHTLASQLAYVACIELIDRTLPGILLSPIEDDWDALLFNQVFKAVTAYCSARISASLNPTVGSDYRSILVNLLGKMKESIPRERFAYRFHGDLHRFLASAISSIGLMMNYTGKLLGHYDGLGSSISENEEELMLSLEKSGLKAWVDVFRRDLDSLFKRLGEWESIQEFLMLNRHIERVLWQFGVFAWRNDQGQVRVEIPLSTDAAQLLKGILPFSIS